MRALHGEHRVAVGDVTDVDLVVTRPATEPGEVGLVIGRVGDDQVAIAAEAVGEEVVEHAALLVAEAGVLGAADLDLRHVVGEHALQEAQRARALDLDLAHVRDVEHPRMGPHRHVLLEDPLVKHRHLPARKRNQLRPELNMPLIQRSASKGSLSAHKAEGIERADEHAPDNQRVPPERHRHPPLLKRLSRRGAGGARWADTPNGTAE